MGGIVFIIKSTGGKGKRIKLAKYFASRRSDRFQLVLMLDLEDRSS